MKVLVIGGGGREHALLWRLALSPRATKFFCAPGNAGIASLAECVDIPVTETDRLAAFAVEHRIDFTVVGPEAALCAGIVDAFTAKGLRIFGPTRRAAQLEGSKVFAKQFLLKHKIPTANAEIFDNADAARAFVRKSGVPIVIKADGLASGKGVVVAGTVEEAERAIADLQRFGGRLVIEECLRGEEVSVMALVDGQTFRLLPAAQDHKRIGDGDTGPNTGGMGAFSPTPVVSAKHEPAIREIFEKTLAGLRAESIDYRGVLYAGLMITRDGPKVLEFNCRFGDPETQALVPRMDFDLLDALEATAAGQLDAVELRWKSNAAVCVVIASRGYPAEFWRGELIGGLQAVMELANVAVFHAGTRRNVAGQYVTDGGRVLGVTAWGADVAAAAQLAYRAARIIHFDGAQYRRDIGARALGRG